MKIFDYDNYKKWFIDWVDNRPNKGYGEFSKLAEFLNSSSTVISQIFKGDRDLSLEQAKKLAEFCQLTDLETKYLMQLALIARAGNFELKTYFEGEKNKIREECQQVKSRISPTRLLSDSEKALLVSSWMPTALLILAGKADGINRAEAASELFVQQSESDHWLSLLVEKGLLVEMDGRFKNGSTRLHIDKGSPYITRHYTNWRLKGIANAESAQESDLFYTSVASVAEADIPKLKEKLMQAIADYARGVSESPAEKVVCLNLDFFQLGFKK